MHDAWERASGEYLARRGSNVSVVRYGNLAPTEDDLGLLGQVQGLRILDIGCGGGQNAVALAKSGASVVGIDSSSAQIAAAERLATEHGVDVVWMVGDAAAVDEGDVGKFDRVLAVQMLQYMDDPAAMIVKAEAMLQPGGALLMSIDHPLRECFYDAELEEFAAFPVRSYVQAHQMHWNFGAGIPMWSQHRPLGQWIEWLSRAGLCVTRVIEADAPLDVQDELWPEDSPLAPLRYLPHTAILVAQRMPR